MKYMTAFARISLGFVSALALTVSFAGCSGGSNSQTPAVGFVNTSLSDPATCSAPKGPYSHVYVTIVDVKASTNATAGDNDPSFVDLTPGLTPTQIDLLGTANTQCLLASLASKTQIAAGSYQQFRVILLDNGSASKVANNKCPMAVNAANCVQLAADSSFHALLLSSEAQTGIKIPSGQIAGGQFTVPAGQTKDLNIDFNACASIVIEGSGQYRLKPVLHAGEVSVASSVGGKVVDKATGMAIAGGKTVVALEQKDASNIDRVIMETVPDASGSFTLCPVPAGTFDVVAVAVDGKGVAYAATVVTGVQPGASLGNVALVAESGMNTSQATITGRVTTAKSGGGTVADISVSALQSVSIGGSPVLVTIPLAQQSSATATLTTAAGAACPAATDCASYSLGVPAANPSVGAAGSMTFTQDTTSPVNYTVDALAFVPMSGNTTDCSPPEQKTASPVTVTAGMSVSAADLAFTGCQ